MATESLTRYAPLTGVAFAVLMVAGALTIGDFSYVPPAEEVLTFFEEDGTRIYLGSYIGLLGMLALLWFAGSVRDFMAADRPDSRRLSTVAFGGAVAGAAQFMIGYVAIIAGAARVDDAGGITEGAATALFDLWGSLGGVGAPIALAALVGAVGLFTLRTGAFPRWLGWASLALAVGLASPVSYVFIAVVLIWAVLVAILIFRAQTV